MDVVKLNGAPFVTLPQRGGQSSPQAKNAVEVEYVANDAVKVHLFGNQDNGTLDARDAVSEYQAFARSKASSSAVIKEYNPEVIAAETEQAEV